MSFEQGGRRDMSEIFFFLCYAHEEIEDFFFLDVNIYCMNQIILVCDL